MEAAIAVHVLHLVVNLVFQLANPAVLHSECTCSNQCRGCNKLLRTEYFLVARRVGGRLLRLNGNKYAGVRDSKTRAEDE